MREREIDRETERAREKRERRERERERKREREREKRVRERFYCSRVFEAEGHTREQHDITCDDIRIQASSTPHPPPYYIIYHSLT